MSARSPRLFAFAALALLALPLSAKDLLVSAAASLSDAFKEIGSQYQQQNPGVTVRLNTAGSGTLLQQLLQGARRRLDPCGRAPGHDESPQPRRKARQMTPADRQRTRRIAQHRRHLAP